MLSSTPCTRRFGSTPQTEQQPANDPADRSDRLHGRQYRRIAARACQQHGRGQHAGESRRQVDKKEGDLQAQQAAPRRDVAEAVDCLLQQTASARASRFAHRGRGRSASVRDRADGDDERHSIDQQDAAQPDHHQQRRRQRGRDHPGKRPSEASKPLARPYCSRGLSGKLMAAE